MHVISLARWQHWRMWLHCRLYRDAHACVSLYLCDVLACVTFLLVWHTCLWYRLKNLTALQMVLSCSCLCDVHTCVTFMLVWHSYLCDAHACVTFILVWRSRQCDVHACVTFILVYKIYKITSPRKSVHCYCWQRNTAFLFPLWCCLILGLSLRLFWPCYLKIKRVVFQSLLLETRISPVTRSWCNKP